MVTETRNALKVIITNETMTVHRSILWELCIALYFSKKMRYEDTKSFPEANSRNIEIAKNRRYLLNTFNEVFPLNTNQVNLIENKISTAKNSYLNLTAESLEMKMFSDPNIIFNNDELSTLKETGKISRIVALISKLHREIEANDVDM